MELGIIGLSTIIVNWWICPIRLHSNVSFHRIILLTTTNVRWQFFFIILQNIIRILRIAGMFNTAFSVGSLTFKSFTTSRLVENLLVVDPGWLVMTVQPYQLAIRNSHLVKTRNSTFLSIIEPTTVTNSISSWPVAWHISPSRLLTLPRLQ